MIFKFLRKDGSEDVHDTDEKRYLPEPLRARAVEYLRGQIDSESFEQVRAAHAENPTDWYVAYHFGAGMGVRNLLRDIIKDEELPPVPYGDESYSNWDDYYVEVLEEAAGCYDD